MTVDVDATAAGTPLEPVWAFYGYDEPNYTTSTQGVELLRALSAAHATPVRVRTHFLFNTGDGMPVLKWGSTNVYSEDAVGNPVYDYTLIDQILVWNYHDHLVEAAPAPVTLRVAVPPAFGAQAAVTHTRVDHAHGDAFTVWASQGSPPTPSAVQLAALEEAMDPVVLERERAVDVTRGAVSLSFDLPRFGISLLTLEPSGSEPPAASKSDAGCSCRLPASARTPLPALVAVTLAGVFAYRRRLARRRAGI